MLAAQHLIALPGHTERSLDIILFASVGAVGLLVAVAQRVRVPLAVFLVVAGLITGFIPGVPAFTLDPNLVFLIFLPPLIYSAAYFTSLRELRANKRSIGLLSIGLVVTTTVLVAVVGHAVVGLSWAIAFALGALVSPTDPIAASQIMERLSVPRRILYVIEGESLLNDGSGLVLYRVAVAAAVTGTFSAWHAATSFAWNVVGGILIGIMCGAGIAWVRRRNAHGPTDVLLSLLSGYVAYLPADALGASGVLATVSAGIWLGWRTPTIVRDAETRLQINGIWTNVSFVLNAALFLLVGLQLHHIVERLRGHSVLGLAGDAAAICGAVILTRLLWVFPGTSVPRWLSPKLRERDPTPPWQETLVIGWIGMRGAITLAAALALPYTMDNGHPFPDRDLLIFLSFCVILVTLLLQGLTLPALLRSLDLRDDGRTALLEAHARKLAARAAIDRIDELVSEDWVRADTAERVRGSYGYREKRFASQLSDTGEASNYELRSASYIRFMREVHQAERLAVLDLRDNGTISEDVMAHIQRDLDLEDARLDS